MTTLLGDAATWDAQSTTPARARGLVEQLLARGGHSEHVATATLLTSELVTNAVEHAGGLVSVRAGCDGDVLRVEVADGGSEVPRCIDVADDAVAGRGMRVLDALATRWSTHPVRGGKVVWFELVLR